MEWTLNSRLHPQEISFIVVLFADKFLFMVLFPLASSSSQISSGCVAICLIRNPENSSCFGSRLPRIFEAPLQCIFNSCVFKRNAHQYQCLDKPLRKIAAILVKHRYYFSTRTQLKLVTSQ